MKAKILLLFMLLIFGIAATVHSTLANAGGDKVQSTQVGNKAKTSGSEDSRYPGYSVDGRTSASVLAAQRSHTPAGEDERNFAIYTGIVVIFIIVFLAQIKFFDK